VFGPRGEDGKAIAGCVARPLAATQRRCLLEHEEYEGERRGIAEGAARPAAATQSLGFLKHEDHEVDTKSTKSTKKKEEESQRAQREDAEGAEKDRANHLAMQGDSLGLCDSGSGDDWASSAGVRPSRD
jgi:hypothetical protein